MGRYWLRVYRGVLPLSKITALGHAAVVHVVKILLGSQHGAGLGLGGLADATGAVDLDLLNDRRVAWGGAVHARLTWSAGTAGQQQCQGQGKIPGRRNHAGSYTPAFCRRYARGQSFASRLMVA